ncbi:MAG: MaoC family dehydratase N-terminal domain-containing protein [Planctomycetes bacterium]|nr:MaoC family dehydratase N-terminal domain-containing protein [Planctomycetota bacterium]
MALNRACIGRGYDGPEVEAAREDMMAYARGTQDDHPWYTDPARPGGIVAPPVFPVRLMQALGAAMLDPDLGADLLRLVHGEQDMRFLGPVRPGDVFVPRAEVAGIEDQSSGQLLRLRIVLSRRGQPAVDTLSSMFIRSGAKGSRGERGPAADGPPRPPVAFDDTVEVLEDQPWRYAEVSGDHNPIHVDVDWARRAGFRTVILQGLCTLAFASQAVVKDYLGGRPERVRRLAARFARPVFPLDRVTTRGWVLGSALGVTTVGFESTNQDGAAVLVNGLAEVLGDTP